MRKVRLILARTLLNYGIPLLKTTKVDSYFITFKTTSFIEYFLRAEESYSREKVTMYWIRNYIQRNDVVLDIGANVGAYSLLIGKIVSTGRGKVYAVEPEASNYSALNENIRINALSNTVIPFSFAFGDSHRVSQFFLASAVSGSALHAIDRPVSDGIKFTAQHVQGVLVDSVDSFLSNREIEFPNHIKIDVDGVEKEIIENMSGTLMDPRLRTVMVEIETELSAGTIENTFALAGFREVMREQMANRSIYNLLYERS